MESGAGHISTYVPDVNGELEWCDREGWQCRQCENAIATLTGRQDSWISRPLQQPTRIFYARLTSTTTRHSVITLFYIIIYYTAFFNLSDHCTLEILRIFGTFKITIKTAAAFVEFEVWKKINGWWRYWLEINVFIFICIFRELEILWKVTYYIFRTIRFKIVWSAGNTKERIFILYRSY